MEYIAFLKGINVGGHRVSMAELRKQFEKLKFKNVRTFIASGNVIFDSPETDTAALEAKIEAQLEKALGYEVATFIRTPAEIAMLAKLRPFGDECDTPGYRVHVVFARTKLNKTQAAAIAALTSDYETLIARGSEFHWLTRGPFHETKIKAAALNKAVGGPCSARNVQTILKLAAIVGA